MLAAAPRRDGGGMSRIILIDCPQCGLPAEIRDRFHLPSTAGPVEHVKTLCAISHAFTLPAERVGLHLE
jgi:hypothetical protein